MGFFFTYFYKIIVIAIFLWQALAFNGIAQNNDVKITIHIRGVYESKISLLALSANTAYKPILEVKGVKNGETTKLVVPQKKLPGEFVLRFDYKETESSTPYPSEKHMFIGDQDLELWVNPKYCNSTDSTYFQRNEKENSTFFRFSKENARQREKLVLLQNFLMNYDDIESLFYQQGIIEYEKRQQAYNTWLTTQSQQDSTLFVSALYCLQYVPPMSWKGSETDRIENLINHYFDGMDFNNPLLIKTAELNKWMDKYVNLYGGLYTTTALRDSLFPLAGKIAIEKARQGHPLVYGWMVDYFYRGYETNGIDAGMKILEPYLKDPTCLTSKRQEISRRLEGMETLIAGRKAPNIILNNNKGNLIELNTLETQGKYILVLFWSADCSHCMEVVEKIYHLDQKPEVQQKMKILDISLDETETEIKAWEKKLKELQGWEHLRAAEGINSNVARDYFVLATPVMVLLDSKKKEIIAVPKTINELLSAIQ